MRRSGIAVLLFASACTSSSTTANCPSSNNALATSSPPVANTSTPSSAAPVPAVRPANPADVASIDAILAALYGSVSGPPGPRDWDRVRSIFAPNALVAPVEHLPDGGADAKIMSIDAFIERASKNASHAGFYEQEIARKTEAFGSIVHVFSTYEARHSLNEPPFRRGINSIQLLKDGDRYWIVSVYWDTEREGISLPDAYLPARK
jgi:hypothetical protein